MDRREVLECRAARKKGLAELRWTRSEDNWFQEEAGSDTETEHNCLVDWLPPYCNEHMARHVIC